MDTSALLEPSVDIIIPCFNGERYLSQTIESALKQTYAVSVVIVDDGSTDRSAEVARSFGPRVSYVFKKNGGQASARNVGLKASRAKYVVLLDADDLLQPSMVGRLVAELEADPSLGVAYSDHHAFRFGRPDRPVAENWRPQRDWPSHLNAFALLCAVHGSASLFRRSLFDVHGFYEEGRELQGCEDWELWFRFAKAGVGFRRVAEPLCLYRQHPWNSSADPLGVVRRETVLVQKLAVMNPNPSHTTAIFHAVGILLVAAKWLSLGRVDEAVSLANVAQRVVSQEIWTEWFGSPQLTSKEALNPLLVNLGWTLLELDMPEMAAVPFLRLMQPMRVTDPVSKDRFDPVSKDRFDLVSKDRFETLCAAMTRCSQAALASSASPSFWSHVVMNLARLSRGDWSTLVRQAYTLNPNHPALQVRYAAVCLSQGQLREALNQLEQTADTLRYPSAAELSKFLFRRFSRLIGTTQLWPA